jgi:glycosyltransferase involved in cell wall biosynthesis
MRVAIDCRYVRERPSGIGAYVHSLVERIPSLAPADRFELWVDPRAPRPLSPAPNVRETLVPAAANGLRTLLCPALLADLAGTDVLHAPFNILGRGLPCRSVVTVHDLMWLLAPALAEGLSPATPLKALFYRDGIVRALRHATRLIAISNATADSVSRLFPEARRRLRVVPHGVEARFRPPEDREAVRARLAQRFGLDGPYFLVVGQNTPSKNHGAVLRAFASARLPEHVRLVFLHRLYRDRWQRPIGGLGALARRLGLAERVSSLPAARSDELVELLQGATALVQFSRFEGFGLPALEALACGAPVVASEIPALVEVLGGAALHVPLEVPALGEALARIFGDAPLRAELRARGLERSRQFCWERSAALHLEIYREAAGSPPLMRSGGDSRLGLP